MTNCVLRMSLLGPAFTLVVLALSVGTPAARAFSVQVVHDGSGIPVHSGALSTGSTYDDGWGGPPPNQKAWANGSTVDWTHPQTTDLVYFDQVRSFPGDCNQQPDTPAHDFGYLDKTSAPVRNGQGFVVRPVSLNGSTLVVPSLIHTVAPDISATEAEFLGYINRDRIAARLAPLVLDSRLNRAADSHSFDLDTLTGNDPMKSSHCGRERADGIARMGEAWYLGTDVANQVLMKVPNRNEITGGFIEKNGVLSAFETFKSSSAHYSIMMNPSFNCVGVGISGSHVTANFSGGVKCDSSDQGAVPPSPSLPLATRLTERTSVLRLIRCKAPHAIRTGARRLCLQWFSTVRLVAADGSAVTGQTIHFFQAKSKGDRIAWMKSNSTGYAKSSRVLVVPRYLRTSMPGARRWAAKRFARVRMAYYGSPRFEATEAYAAGRKPQS